MDLNSTAVGPRADRELDVRLEQGWAASTTSCSSLTTRPLAVTERVYVVGAVRSAGAAPWDGRLQPKGAVVLRPRSTRLDALDFVAWGGLAPA